jgi:hypothetical protein
MPVQVLNKSIRDEIYRRTLAAVCGATGAPDDPTLLIGRCLDFAWEGYQIIKAWPGAPRTIIQAGSAQWPRVPPEMDDGHSPTHFAYEWDPESQLARLALAGVAAVVQRADGHVAPSLPEMHVWLGCPDTAEIVDFTTGLWPLTCRAMLGLGWPAPLPPAYFWSLGTHRPAEVNYVPARDAIDCVIALLRRQGRQYP